MFEIFEKYFPSQFGSSFNQLKDFIFREQEKMFASGEEARNQIHSVAELTEYNQNMRQCFLKQMDALPHTDEPVEATITKRSQHKDFTLEEVILKVAPGNYITGSMYLPLQMQKPNPAILFVCGHSPNARMADHYQTACQILVKAGLVVFAIDPTGQGERANHYDSEHQSFFIERATRDHDSSGVPAIATGRFLQSYFLFDEMRALDYMLTRPEIDPARIGMTGCSGGGTQTAAMMLCDDRIAAAAPAAFITNRREYMYTCQPQDSEQIWPGLTQHGFDHVNAFLQFAPKPVAILALDYDFFCIEGTMATYREAKRFYELYGKGDNLRIYTERNLHGYPPQLAAYAAAFFCEVFFGKSMEAVVPSVDLLPETDMYATKSGQITVDFADAKPLQQRVREYAAQLRRERNLLSPAVRLQRAKEWLWEQVNKQRTPTDFYVRMYPESHCQTDHGYLGVPVKWWTQHRLFSFGVMIKSQQYRNRENLPTVIALWNDGTDQIHAHADWIQKTCDQGKQVLILDMPGIGEMYQAHMTRHHDSLKNQFGTLYTLCGNLMYGGDSMAAMHCYDVLRTIRMVSERFQVDPRDITLYCDEQDGVYGVMAGFLEDRVQMEYGPNLLLNVEKEILGQDHFQYDNTLCLLVPGMLRYFDYHELLR